MKKQFLIFPVLFFLAINNTFAWSKEGHELVAEYAKTYSSKSAQDSVNKYLGDMTWEKAATWMDDVRSDHSYDYLKPTHYINIEKDKTYVKTSEKNIMTELELVISELKNRKKLTKDEIALDLRILFHLVGDLHMPLHAGYSEDKGGNTVDVNYNGKKMNLHHLWDGGLIDGDKNFKSELESLSKKLSPQEIKSLQKSDMVAWLNQSKALVASCYDYKNGEISDEYAKKNLPVIQKQILDAGVRLAGVLDEVFGK